MKLIDKVWRRQAVSEDVRVRINANVSHRIDIDVDGVEPELIRQLNREMAEIDEIMQRAVKKTSDVVRMVEQYHA
ncbi:MAG TPA: hypothetical protein VKU87_00275 [Thermomicrobiaceae bacterium]|nr:hypothetical protein [Thermomicrobiaceae bacterium]